ncbi:DoxX family protein [uncultured Maribacter sp.]|uniref:DoxX family protein n=1 Tax=uncultured Maribacter sp. TaxID=431308 RepID=UPI0026058C99|nr:DoxX family protein [uncultured Maribacter sp.]
MNTNKIIYYIATGIFTLVILFSANLYFFKHDMVKVIFTKLGYPTYLIYPYATAKLIGLFAIWNPKFHLIKEWAYSAFFFAVTLAITAHVMINDGGQMIAVIAIVSLIVSYIFSKRI